MIRMPFFFLFLIGSFGLGCASDDSRPTAEATTTTIPFTGKVNWIKTLGGSLNDEAKAIANTLDGGYALLGNAESIDGDLSAHATATQDFWVLKLGPTGETLWNKTYGGDDDDRGEAIVATTDGGFLVSGYSRSATGDVSANNGSYDHWMIRLDANGDKLWEKNYGYLGDDRAFTTLQTKDNGFLTAGFLDVESYNGTNTQKDDLSQKNTAAKHGVGEFWVHKLTPDGALEWERYYGGTSNDRAYDVIQTDDDGYMLVGATESFDFDISNNNGSYDYWVIKIDALGELLWEKTFGGSGLETAYAITKSNDGNYLIAGDTRSDDGAISQALGNADVWILKIDPSGVLLWEQTFGGTDYDTVRDIMTSSDGRYIVLGSTKSTDGTVSKALGSNDLWLLKIDDNATVVWNASFGGRGFDFGYGVVEDANKNIISVGNTQSSDISGTTYQGGQDAFIISIQQ